MLQGRSVVKSKLEIIALLRGVGLKALIGAGLASAADHPNSCTRQMVAMRGSGVLGRPLSSVMTRRPVLSGLPFNSWRCPPNLRHPRRFRAQPGPPCSRLAEGVGDGVAPLQTQVRSRYGHRHHIRPCAGHAVGVHCADIVMVGRPRRNAIAVGICRRGQVGAANLAPRVVLPELVSGCAVHRSPRERDLTGAGRT